LHLLGEVNYLPFALRANYQVQALLHAKHWTHYTQLVSTGASTNTAATTPAGGQSTSGGARRGQWLNGGR
jgi:hypothetical protein